MLVRCPTGETVKRAPPKARPPESAPTGTVCQSRSCIGVCEDLAEPPHGFGVGTFQISADQRHDEALRWGRLQVLELEPNIGGAVLRLIECVRTSGPAL